MSSPDALDNGQTGLLSEAALSVLQINLQPFVPSQDEDGASTALFSDEVTEEQLADIKQALITGDDLLLILGEDGAGKTTLLSQLGANSGLRIQCFAVKGSSRFSTMNLFAGMLEAFKRKPPETLKQILDDLIPCLQTMVSRNTLSAIVLDDAHNVSETELTQLLSAMLYVNSQDETLMRVALAAPSEFEDRIPDLLPEGADLPYSSLTIDGLSPARASAYLGFRLAQVGFVDELPFTERDLATLVDQSAGLPAGLHGAAAEELNQRHGAFDESLPAELLDEPARSPLHSRMGKIALGSLATLLIVAGIAMFLKPEGSGDANRHIVANQDQIETEKKLKLLKNEPVVLSEDKVSPIATNSSGQNDDVTGSDQNLSETPSDESSLAAATALPASNDSTPAPVSEPVPEEPDTAEPVQQVAQDTREAASESLSEETIVEVAELPDTESTISSAANEAVQIESDVDIDAESNADSDATNELIAEVTSTEQGSAEQTDTADETQTEDATKEPGFLESPNWILVQSANQFTVQMSASRDRASVENFLQRNPLDPPNSIFSFDRDGDTWFALVHGLFPSIEDARQAVEKMPASAQTNQPWIRSVGRVQSVLKAQ
ncbi:MAG: SPOR domain-containing protein [Granulosicoccus sp.]